MTETVAFPIVPGSGRRSDAVPWGETGLFVLLSFALGAASWIGLRTLAVPLLPRTLLAMFGPLLAARVLGYRRPAVPTGAAAMAQTAKTGLRSIALVALLLGGGLAMAFAAGLQGFRSVTRGEVGEVAVTFPLLLAIYMLSAYGEEYGWRGFLQDKLSPLGPTRTALITAPIWGLWHSPAILLDGFDYPHHRILGLGMIFVFAVPFSLILSWLRTFSGGLVAPTAAHAAFDAFAAIIALTTWHTTMVLSAPMGLIGFVPFALLAVVLLVRRESSRASNIIRLEQRGMELELEPLTATA